MSKVLTIDEAIQLMSDGDIDTLGLMPWGSNYTFLVKITPKGVGPTSIAEEDELLGVYKPRKGETPLWDFPDGTLCMREMASYLVNRELGWHIIPPTILRSGDHGIGSVQLYIDSDPDQHFFTFRDDPLVQDDLRKIALFDLITNNADRKSGHCLRDKEGKVWAIDHGITFNTDYKLRTVIWDFAGQPIPNEYIADLQALRKTLSTSDAALTHTLCRLLDEAEIKTFLKRLDGLLKIKVFPSPNRYERSTPWPPV